MASESPILELRSVSFRYPTWRRKELPVLDGVSLEVAGGETCAILGPSGIGKTTLARLAAGIHHPTAGEVRYKGKVLNGPNPAITVSFQNYPCFEWLTVEDNLLFGLRERGRLRGEERGAAFDLLEKVGLEGALGKYPRQLSGGMLQRLSIARALAVSPRVLILDEPFSAVDRPTKRELIALLLDLQAEQGFSLLVILHDLEDAYHIADRAVVLNGRPAAPTLRLELSGLAYSAFEREIMGALGEDHGDRGPANLLEALRYLRSHRIPPRNLISQLTPRARAVLAARLGERDGPFVLKLLREHDPEKLSFAIQLAEALAGSRPEVRDAMLSLWQRPLPRELRLELIVSIGRSGMAVPSETEHEMVTFSLGAREELARVAASRPSPQPHGCPRREGGGEREDESRLGIIVEGTCRDGTLGNPLGSNPTPSTGSHF